MYEDHDLVYLSGAISNRTPAEAKAHFKEVQNQLTGAGYTVVNPMVIETNDWFEGMKQCIKKLVDCNYVFMLNGWQDSRGALIERTLAMELNIPVVYEDKDPFNLTPKRIDG
tara:strand:+ start:10203 stop:10538 length:336 start_codon:yes stop_codon:yes gene_type:complete